jgi:glycoprotein-N-acetylgalactosamine 3-beta-galactosyltransferase
MDKTQSLLSQSLLSKEVKILCWVMTNPANHATKAKAVKETWGKRCNKLLFMSTELDAELGTVALNVVEGRDYLWAKTKEAFRYVYRYHLDDYDWFYKADDDT